MKLTLCLILRRRTVVASLSHRTFFMKPTLQPVQAREMTTMSTVATSEHNGIGTAASSLTRPGISGAACNLAFNERVNGLKAQGKNVYHFGFGQSPFPVWPAMAEALKHEVGQHAYLPVAGIPQLRQAICDFHEEYDGLSDITPDQIVVAPGSKELIFLLMQVFNGDILIVSPAWTTYRPQALLAGHTPYIVTTDMDHQWRISPTLIDKTIKENKLTGNKLLILCNPCNPSGASYAKEHLQEIGNYCRENNVIVLTDEIYARLHYGGCHDTMYRYYPEGTIVSSGYSKWASAGGWRMGYHIYPQQLEELRRHVISGGSHTFSCAPAPMQYAIAKALKANKTECHDYIVHTRRIMATVAEFCYRELTDIGVLAAPSSAGYYFMPDFEVFRPGFNKRGIYTGQQMCEAMLQECGVALMPGGPAFLRPENELTVRFCYVNFDGTDALQASSRIGLDTDLPDGFLQTYATPVVDGVKSLKDWLLKHQE